MKRLIGKALPFTKHCKQPWVVEHVKTMGAVTESFENPGDRGQVPTGAGTFSVTIHTYVTAEF